MGRETGWWCADVFIRDKKHSRKFAIVATLCGSFYLDVLVICPRVIYRQLVSTVQNSADVEVEYCTLMFQRLALGKGKSGTK